MYANWSARPGCSTNKNFFGSIYFSSRVNQTLILHNSLSRLVLCGHAPPIVLLSTKPRSFKFFSILHIKMTLLASCSIEPLSRSSDGLGRVLSSLVRFSCDKHKIGTPSSDAKHSAFLYEKKSSQKKRIRASNHKQTKNSISRVFHIPQSTSFFIFAPSFKGIIYNVHTPAKVSSAWMG